MLPLDPGRVPDPALGDPGGGKWGLYSPPGTSNAWDVKKVNLDIPEGRTVTITIYDDKAMKQRVGQITGRA
ncbi:hypothetical protein N7925_11355 [Streptomyces sp. CA-278952]|uniref:hypothetical protein n=1 Tax=unclassified Streptomyces TaxID=2593676 RepID=UPI002368B99D|nr:hypothetical protein [Streptomyces sp. CA-278952]WDG28908.1 hypothetical protein N7925_11355 [Streptomyces sp. CA-278952]